MPRNRSQMNASLSSRSDYEFPQGQYGYYPPVNQCASPEQSRFDASCAAKEDTSTASQYSSFQRQRNKEMSLDIQSSKQENLSDVTPSSICRYVIAEVY